MKRIQRICTLLIPTLLVAALLAGCHQPAPSAAPTDPAASIAPHASSDPSPAVDTSGLTDFEKQLVEQANNVPLEDFTLPNLDGQMVSTADFRGKILLLNAASSWCGYCKQEYPILQSASQQYAEQVAVVGIDTFERQSFDKVEAILRSQLTEAGVTYPVLVDDDSSIGKWMSPRGSVPTTLLVDADGIVRFMIPGAFPNEDMLFQILDFMLQHPDLLPAPSVD